MPGLFGEEGRVTLSRRSLSLSKGRNVPAVATAPTPATFRQAQGPPPLPPLKYVELVETYPEVTQSLALHPDPSTSSRDRRLNGLGMDSGAW